MLVSGIAGAWKSAEVIFWRPMEMKTISRIALGFALAVGVAGAGTAVPAFAQDKKADAAPEPRKYKYSKKAQKLLMEAQTAQQAGDNDTALAKIREVEAIAETPDDRYMANQLKINVAIGKQDNTLLEEGLSKSIEGGQLDAATKLKFQRNLAALAVQRNDLPRAIQVYEQMVAENPSDGELIVALGEMYHRAKRTPDAVKTLRKAIDVQTARGVSVPENWYKRALALAYDGKLAGEVTSSSLLLVRNYPTPTNWRDALVIFRDSAGFEDQGNLDVMRLMYDTKALSGERDYFEYAETAHSRGLPGESKKILDEGVAKGVLSPGKLFVKELQGIVTPRVKGDRASLAGLERESRAAANGRLSKATADGYLSYGENAKAVELYRLALQKGGVDAAEVNTRIGIALARSGDKAGAEAAFKAVTSGKRAELAQFWLAHLNAAPAAAQTASTGS
jgi:tetratricopeptide (TPR) repeat protein